MRISLVTGLLAALVHVQAQLPFNSPVYVPGNSFQWPDQARLAVNFTIGDIIETLFRNTTAVYGMSMNCSCNAWGWWDAHPEPVQANNTIGSFGGYDVHQLRMRFPTIAQDKQFGKTSCPCFLTLHKDDGLGAASYGSPLAQLSGINVMFASTGGDQGGFVNTTIVSGSASTSSILALPSGTRSGTVAYYVPTASGYVTTSATSGTVMSTTTLAIPRGTTLGTVEVFVPNTIGYVTTTISSGSATTTITAAAASGTNPGIVQVFVPTKSSNNHGALIGGVVGGVVGGLGLLLLAFWLWRRHSKKSVTAAQPDNAIPGYDIVDKSTGPPPMYGQTTSPAPVLYSPRDSVQKTVTESELYSPMQDTMHTPVTPVAGDDTLNPVAYMARAVPDAVEPSELSGDPIRR